MESNSIITNSVYEGVNRKKPIRRVKPLKCYNKGQPLPKVEPTVAPVINTSSEVKTSVSLLKGDCLEVMKGLPDKSVDLIICDLPYGCLSNEGKSKITPQKAKQIWGDWAENKLQSYGAGCSWDIKLNLEVFWKEVKRIRRDDHTPCIHFCNTKFGYDLIKSNEKEFRYDLVWDKQRGVSFLSANKMPMKSHEMIYVFSKLGANYNRIDIEGDFKKWNVKREGQTAHTYGEAKRTSTEGGDGIRCVKSIVTIDGHLSRSKGQHPTCKPVELYKFLIERYSSEGDEVLDPTFGSCNSGFACKELNRKFIGIEKNDAFFWKAVNRTAK